MSDMSITTSFRNFEHSTLQGISSRASADPRLQNCLLNLFDDSIATCCNQVLLFDEAYPRPWLE